MGTTNSSAESDHLPPPTRRKDRPTTREERPNPESSPLFREGTERFLGSPVELAAPPPSKTNKPLSAKTNAAQREPIAPERTAAEVAAEEYQTRLQEKREAEERAIRRLRLDEFDPIRPLDSFNVTHRSLLGRCWDRRRVELLPIVQLWHYVNDNGYSLPSGWSTGVEVSNSNEPLPNTVAGGSRCSPVFSGRNWTEMTPQSVDYHSPQLPERNNSRTSSQSDVSIQSNDTDRIRRSSHWFSVCLVASESLVSSSQKQQRSLLFPSGTLYKTPANPQDPLLNACADDIYAAANAVELVHQMTMEQRQELYAEYMNHIPRLAGGTPYFAFRLGPESCTSDRSKFLRKRGLTPAKGVEVVRWNRVELMRPSLELIGRSVSRIQAAEAMVHSGSSANLNSCPGGPGIGGRGDGTRNLHAGDVNVSFAGKLTEAELSQLLGAGTSPTASMSQGPAVLSTSSISSAVFEEGQSARKKELFPLDAVHCHSVGFSLDALDQDNSSTLAVAVNCFSTSVDPYQCEANGGMRYPIDLDDSNPKAMEQFGEGVITDIMYGGTMIIESNSKQGISKLEDLLASLEWSKPRAMVNIVKEVREHARQRRSSTAAGVAEATTPKDEETKFRILRRIGGRPVRDAVELSEICVLLGEASSAEMQTMPLQSSALGSSGVHNSSSSAGSMNCPGALAYSRVASAWVCLNTMLAALRAWVLHLLENPEYSQPISLFLQKFAGVATALQMSTAVVSSAVPHGGVLQGKPLLGDGAVNVGKGSESGGLEGPAGEELVEDETSQVLSQIFAVELNLERYMREKPHHTTSDHHHHHHLHRNFTCSPGASWMPRQAPSTFFEILGNIASSSSASHSWGSVTSHTSTPTSSSDGRVVTSRSGQHVARGPSKRSVARALLRGSATSLRQLDFTPAPSPGGLPNPSFTVNPGTKQPPAVEPRGIHKPSNLCTLGGEESSWRMARMELQALQKDLEELQATHEVLREEHEHAAYALETVTKVFLPTVQSRTLLPVLLNLRVAIRYPDELHAEVLHLNHRDWFPMLVAVWSSPRCHVRRVRVSTPLTGKDLPKLGMAAGLLQMGYAGRQLRSLEFHTAQLLSQGVVEPPVAGGGLFLTGSATRTNGNHGLPPNMPPFIVNGEQVRDTLYVLLSSVTENQEAGEVHITLKGYPRRGEGSFHGISSFFRSKTYKRMVLQSRYSLHGRGRLPQDNLRSLSGASFPSSTPGGNDPGLPTGRGSATLRGKTRGGCCGGGSDSSSSEEDDEGGGALTRTQSGTGSVWGSFHGSLHAHLSSTTGGVKHHRHDPAIRAAKERGQRAASERLPGPGPPKEVYPFYSILCHQCRCDPQEEDQIRRSFAHTSSNGSALYRNCFNTVHNHEGYAKFTSQVAQHQSSLGHHHIPPMPYFAPLDSGPPSWENSAVSPLAPPRNPSHLQKNKAAVEPHWHFGFPNYEEEEAEMKRAEQMLCAEARDIIDALEDAVKNYNRQEKPFRLTLSL